MSAVLALFPDEQAALDELLDFQTETPFSGIFIGDFIDEGRQLMKASLFHDVEQSFRRKRTAHSGTVQVFLLPDFLGERLFQDDI